VSKIKATDINIGKYFDISTATLRRWKKGTPEKQRCYQALKEFFIKEHGLSENE
jgi:hypothetical protein